MARVTNRGKLPSPEQAWVNTRAAQANRNYGMRQAVRYGIASGRLGDITEARAQLVAPNTDIWETLPVSKDDPTYGGPDPGTEGRYEYAVDTFEWADEYFDYFDSGYESRNLSSNPSPNQAPAPISVVPTNTINPDRPRTVAAGYDRDRSCLTVVFRDGTFYNYLEVTPREWMAFKMSKSKGRYIKRVLDAKPRGIANATAVPVTVRSALYNVARVAQYTGDEEYQQAELIHRYFPEEKKKKRKRK